MFTWLWRLFRGTKLPTGPYGQPSAKAIYDYVTGLDQRDRDRLHQETWYRGLSFGDLRVDSASLALGVVFVLDYKEGQQPSFDGEVGALRDALAESGLSGISVESGGTNSSTMYLVLTDEAPASLDGIFMTGSWSYPSGEAQPFELRLFMQMRRSSDTRLEITVYSVEATEVARLL
ncbi:MAG: hypothetical protein PHT12_05710, partial [Patescibacteria group bacterium]|nr:hypothetical protein [Patescibacteria group bacterium]